MSSSAGTSAAAASATRRCACLDPVVLLDAAVELQGLVEVGDVVVGEVGDLLELDGVELTQAAGEIGVDTLDLRQILGLALRLLEALPLRIEAAGAGVRALGDTGRLAAAAAQVIELRAADFAAAQDLDLGDVGRVDREHALHALAVGNLAHGEVLVDAGAGAADHHALVGLGADAVALDHLHHHLDGIAGAELGHAALCRDGAHLLALELLDDIHGPP